MVSISYNFQVAEMGHMNPVHRTRTVLAEGSCRSFELSMFGRPATVRDLKDSVIEHLGCPAAVQVWGSKLAEVGSDVGLWPYSTRCRELLYLLAGQLYRQGDSDTLLNYQAELSPLADLSSLAGKPLLSVVAYKKAPVKAVLDSSAPQFDIKVKTLTGQWLPFKVRGNMLVEEFKGMVEDAEGIPPGQQRHIFKGIHLQDGRTMSDYGVESAAAELAAQGQVPVLLLMLPLRGGMYHQTSGRHDNESMSAEPLTQR